MNHQFYAQIFGVLSVTLLIIHAACMVSSRNGPFLWTLLIASQVVLIIQPLGVWEANCVVNAMMLVLLLVSVAFRWYIWLRSRQPKRR